MDRTAERREADKKKANPGHAKQGRRGWSCAERPVGCHKIP